MEPDVAILMNVGRTSRALCALVMLAGCEPAAATSAWHDQTTDATVIGDAAGSDTTGDGASVDGQDVPADGAVAGDGATLPTQLSGQWLLASDWSTCVTLGGAPTELRTRKLLLVQMKHVGHGIVEERQVCSVVTTKLFGLQTIVPAAVSQAGGVLRVNSVIFDDGPGGSYLSEPEAQIWGAQLKDVLLDPMPTTIDAGDPTLFDTDNDGKPGATLKIEGICEIYVTQRAVAVLAGTVGKNGSISGIGAHTTEQHVLKATVPICGQKYTTAPNDAQNRFVMVRTDKTTGVDDSGDGDVTCGELVKNQSMLVKWVEPDDAHCPE